jgi:hypothetical protein
LAGAKFTELLLAEVRLTLGGTSPEELALELRDVGLLEYCRPALGSGELAGQVPT